MLSEGCKNDLDIPLILPFGRDRVFPPYFKAFLIADVLSGSNSRGEGGNTRSLPNGQIRGISRSFLQYGEMHTKDVLN